MRIQKGDLVTKVTPGLNNGRCTGNLGIVLKVAKELVMIGGMEARMVRVHWTREGGESIFDHPYGVRDRSEYADALVVVKEVEESGEVYAVLPVCANGDLESGGLKRIKVVRR